VDGSGDATPPSATFPGFAYDAGDPSVVYIAKTRTVDAFVMRLSATGELRYSTLLGGWSNDSIDAHRIDPDGAMRIFGTTGSDDFPLTVAPDLSGGVRHDFVAQ
jgi:hypothetical protein